MVTGSCHLVEFDSAQVLIDCGLFQGEDAGRNQELGFDARDIDAVVLTHAHLDHVGRLPRLYKEGYRGKAWCTAATAGLVGIVLEDARHLDEDSYHRADLELSLQNLVPVDYLQTVALPGGVRARFHHAGHILGSASVELVAEVSILFSGDLGRENNPLLHQAEPPRQAQVVVMESTYGDLCRKSQPNPGDELGKVIAGTLAREGNAVIPAFALEGTQDLLLGLARLQHEGAIAPDHIYLDSPMGVEITELFCRHREELDPRCRQLGTPGACPLYPPGLVFTRTVAESRAINQVHGRAVILASGGMCEGGRILHHLKRNVGRDECAVALAGYQAPGTLGRQLADGARNVRLLGDDIPVKAEIAEIHGLSAHADQAGLCRWLQSMERPQQVFLVHGESSGLHALRDMLSQAGYRVEIPTLGETFQL